MNLRGGLGILIIEDDADTRSNLRDILELDDHQVWKPVRLRKRSP
jgi:DNA-binding NtrC family response regulator